MDVYIYTSYTLEDYFFHTPGSPAMRTCPIAEFTLVNSLRCTPILDFCKHFSFYYLYKKKEFLKILF